MLARRHEDDKNMFLQENHKTNPDNATDNISKNKTSIILSVMKFQMLLFFSLPSDQPFASALPHLGIISSAFSLSNFKLFLTKK